MVKEIIYKALDIILMGRGVSKSFNKNTVRLPVRYFRYFGNNYEEENLNIVNTVIKQGMQIIDVGAHIGLYSVIFGVKVGTTGKVFSFEPTPTTFEVLKKTIRLNKLSEIIKPIQAALSNKSGETVFYISNYEADNSNSLSNNRRAGRTEKGITVRLYSLDDFVDAEKISAIDFIKVDAEGAELQVLKGADHSVEKFHPLILLALHPKPILNFGGTLEEIWDWIQKNKYDVIYHSKKMTRTEFISQQNLFDVFLNPVHTISIN